MIITMPPATRSPRTRSLRERRDAERPVKKRTGTVPTPKRNMVRNPDDGLPVAAALTTMAKENMQGRKPEKSPRAAFATSPFEEMRRAKIQPEMGLGPDAEKERSLFGPAPSIKRPNASIIRPPVRLTPLWSPAKKGRKGGIRIMPAARAPSRPYVTRRPAWNVR